LLRPIADQKGQYLPELSDYGFLPTFITPTKSP